ncbi:MAG TPA: dehydratase [Lachnospiraceae bacterium]|nr:dehydratase [Lachnospiraceae bacterium]
MNDYSYEDISVGQRASFKAVPGEAELAAFMRITGDVNPLHGDEDYAIRQGYKGRVAYGMLTASYLSTLAGVYLPGERSLIHSVEVRFEAPVYAGDELTISGEVTEKNDTFRFITVKVLIRNQDNKKVLKGKMQIGVSDPADNKQGVHEDP